MSQAFTLSLETHLFSGNDEKQRIAISLFKAFEDYIFNWEGGFPIG